ncbi:MAG: immunoglobulin domain-containing protein [Opitutales bacterium]
MHPRIHRCLLLGLTLGVLFGGEVGARAAVNLYSQPVDQSVSGNGIASAYFSVGATGTGNLIYQWYHGADQPSGTALPGATGSTFSLNNVQAGDGGGYFVVVTDDDNNPVMSNVAILNVQPAITTQPAAQSVLVGASVSFSVTATGYPDPTFQWLLNGSNLNGATAAIYTIASAQPGQAGNYSVLVSSGVSSVLSDSVTLTVSTAPMITVQPVSQSVTAGNSVGFSVTATGTAPLSYQWNKDGAPISGATSDTYGITNPQSADAGNYSVTVTNLAGSVTSSNAALTVNTPPSLGTPPGSQAVVVGGSVSFSVTAFGTAPFTYQWSKDGTPIAGAINATYTINAAAVTDAGNYSVLVQNAYGSATSSIATLTVNVPPSITAQPAGQFALPGTGVSFSVTAIGSGTLSYQWYQGAGAIVGATGATYTIDPVTAGSAGDYSVQVANAYGTATSAAATLTVYAPIHTTDFTVADSYRQWSIFNYLGNSPILVTPGQWISLAIQTSAGVGALRYEWLDQNGQVVSTGNSYVIPAVAMSDSGTYEVRVYDDYSFASWDFSLYLTPFVTIHPVSQAVVAGQSVTFSATAIGTGPLGYQWEKNSSNISGATSPTLTINSVSAADAGSYQLAVSSPYGSFLDTPATLTVNVPPGFTSQPSNQTVTAGNSASFSVTATGSGTLSYQWYQGVSPISGATSATYTINPAAAGDAGNYSVVVSSAYGSATSTTVSLTVNVPPSITSQPASQSVTVGGSVSFAVSATGSGGISWQWYKDTVAIPGATAATYGIGTVLLTDAGSYTAVATNSTGSATTNAAVLTVNRAAQTITFAQPPDLAFTLAAVPLIATCDSGLVVTFTVDSGPAVLNGTNLTLTGAGAVTVRASQAGNGTYAAATDVVRTFNVTPDFDAWRRTHFTDGELADATKSGPNSVWGHDGLPNLVKYALGLDPKVDATTGLPTLTTDGTDWIYAYTRPAGLPDVTYAVEASADLKTWTTSGVIHGVYSSANGTDTMHAILPVSGNPNAFFRLVITQP